MGISDRRYMGQDDESFGSFRGHAISAVMVLLFINLAVWLIWQFAPHNPELSAFMETHFMCTPSGVLEKWQLHTLVTSEISHIGARHLIFNMMLLFFLGPDLEHFYGRLNLVALYVFAAVMSSLAQIGLEQLQHVDVPSLGASGAMMGIAIAAAFVDPQKPMLFFGFLPMKLWMLALMYVVLDLSGAINPSDNVAHGAHLGGAFAGMLFFMLDLRVFASRGRANSGLLAGFKRWWRARKFRVIDGGGRSTPPSGSGLSGPASDIPDEGELVAARRARKAARLSERAREKEPPVSVEAERIDPETAKRVDELLEKISRHGMHALNREEREFLRSSSAKYRR